MDNPANNPQPLLASLAVPAVGMVPYRLWLIGTLAAGYAANKDLTGGELGPDRVAAYAIVTADALLSSLDREKSATIKIPPGVARPRRRRSVS